MKYVTKCKKCGKETSVDTSIVLTTYPAQYGYTCEHCGERGLCFTYEAHLINENTYGLQGVRIPDKLHDYVSEQIALETVYNLGSAINSTYIQIGDKQFKTKDFLNALIKLMEENENE